jgi:signal transduction histidine kinase
MVAASILLALLIGAAFAILLVAIDSQRDTARLARHSQQVISTANELERLVVDLETGERGYLLTGDSSFLAPWTDARAAFPGVARRLQQLAEVPDQHRVAERIVAAGESYIDEYSVPLVNAAKRGDPAAKSAATIEEGKTRIDVIRAEFEMLDANEEQLGAERDERSHNAAQRALIAAIAGIAGSVLLVVAFAAYLSRAIVRPIRRAAGMAQRLAGGDLSARMPETGIGEIGTLERSFNTMGGSLERSRDELARLAEEQASLRRVATFVARGVPPSEVFGVVAEEVGRVLEADGVRMLRFESDETVTVVAGWGEPGRRVPLGSKIPLAETNIAVEVLRNGEPYRMDDLSQAGGPLAAAMRELGVRSMVGAPIVVERRVWGVMTAMSRRPDPLPDDTEVRFVDFTDLVATAIANTAARTELAASRVRVVEAIDRSRREIERDLHDGTQQRLVSLALDLRSIEARAEQPELREEVSEVATGLADALDELREISRGIHPAVLTEGGLPPALRALARRSAVPVDLDVRVEGRLSQRIEVAAYYVVAEALTNTAKHANAELVRVRVAREGRQLRLTVSDDGAGGADPSHGSGLIGLIDRVAALDGSITVDSPVGVGTTLHVSLPAEPHSS